jgi:hypothetical protein
VQCTERFCCGMKSPSFNVIRWYTEQWDIIGIYLVYARYMPDIFINLEWLIYQSKENDGTAITSQNSYVQITTNAGDMISFIKMHLLFSIKGIYQVYTKYIHIISLVPPFCRPNWSPKRAWMSQTWTFYGSLPSWPLKVLQL